jgi:hypothetical protein
MKAIRILNSRSYMEKFPSHNIPTIAKIFVDQSLRGRCTHCYFSLFSAKKAHKPISVYLITLSIGGVFLSFQAKLWPKSYIKCDIVKNFLINIINWILPFESQLKVCNSMKPQFIFHRFISPQCLCLIAGEIASANFGPKVWRYPEYVNT